MHQALDLKVLYFGTPVVIISSRNPDGTTNLAPMSSAWWLNDMCVLGLGNSGRTAANLLRERECVLNLVPSTLVGAVDRLALTTGSPVLSAHKQATGYRYEPDKFGAAGLTPQPAELVAPDRVAQCPIQLECEVSAAHPIGEHATAFVTQVRRAHVEQHLIIPGTQHVDPVGWDPLIMKFCEFFGGGEGVHPSRLAAGWRMPHRQTAPAGR